MNPMYPLFIAIFIVCVLFAFQVIVVRSSSNKISYALMITSWIISLVAVAISMNMPLGI